MEVQNESPVRKFLEPPNWLSIVKKAIEKSITRTYPKVGTPGSQYNEFEILSQLLPNNEGCYVDVGAGEPVECSNTWEFYRLGWRGLLIECLPTCLPALLRQRPGDFVYPLAVSDEPGYARLRMNNSLSSVKLDWDISETSELIVECDTLKNILEDFPKIRDSCSLLSIDVEGSEKEVLLGTDWNLFKPKVIIIEAVRWNSIENTTKYVADDWEYLLLEHGYTLHFQGVLNNIYVRN